MNPSEVWRLRYGPSTEDLLAEVARVQEIETRSEN